MEEELSQEELSRRQSITVLPERGSCSVKTHRSTHGFSSARVGDTTSQQNGLAPHEIWSMNGPGFPAHLKPDSPEGVL